MDEKWAKQDVVEIGWEEEFGGVAVVQNGVRVQITVKLDDVHAAIAR